MRHALWLVLLLAQQQAPAPVEFERDIRPIFKASCIKCHGAEGKPKGQFRLDVRAAAFRGGAGARPLHEDVETGGVSPGPVQPDSDRTLSG